MSGFDPFALAGRPEKGLDLAQAAGDFADLVRKWRSKPIGDEHEDVADELLDLIDSINEAEPTSMADCVVKLGAIVFQHRETEGRVESLERVVTFLGREIAGGAA